MAANKSFSSKVKETFQNLPTIVQIIIVLIILVIVYRIVNWIIVKIKTNKLENQIQSEQNAFENSGQKLTFMPSQYSTFSDQLQQAFQYSGTEEGTVIDIISKMKNDLDILELNKAFGKRDIYFWGFTYSFSLPEAIRDEMDVKEVNEILQSKNIQYRY